MGPRSRRLDRGDAFPSRLAGWGALIALGINFITGPALHADIVTLTSQRDNTLYEDPDGSVSNGAGSAMFAGRNSAPADSVRRAVLAFDVAGAIPAGSTIQSVTLALSNSAANVDDAAVSLHRVLSDWGEGTSVASGGGGSGGPAATGDATWLHSHYDTEFWATPGGDFESLISATAIVGGPGDYTWTSTSQFVADVQMFLDEPSLNHGWILVGDESAPGTAKKFATREEASAGLHPVLTVTYLPVPEPSTILLACAGFLLTGREHRDRKRYSGASSPPT